MKAALVEQYHEPLAIRDIPEPAHDSDGVVVAVKACGVCRSDWHGWQGEWPGFTGGSLPHIFGHEFVGLVSDIGNNVSRYRVGDRVIVPFTLGCGHCEYCRSGHSNVCPTVSMPGFSYDGGFAQYVTVPDADANLVKLPDAVDFTDAAGMGCRLMTAYHGIVEVGQIHPGDRRRRGQERRRPGHFRNSAQRGQLIAFPRNPYSDRHDCRGASRRRGVDDQRPHCQGD